MSSLPLSVLILEDHPFQRSVAAKILEQFGCSAVYEAADGVEAMALLEKVGPVDVALCDLQMDGMDGIEFIQRVGSSGQVGSIIVISSLSADLRRAVGQIISQLNLVFLGDLSKPLQANALGELLRKKICTRLETPVSVTQNSESVSEKEVRQALVERQIQAHYQPKIHLATGCVVGVEVLARWEHPSKGLIAPVVFLPMLENLGLMDEWLFAQMNQALFLQKKACQQGFKLNMAFNINAGQLANRELSSRVKKLLNRHCVAGAGVTFEVTESGLLEAPSDSIECLVRLRMMGCRLSIDDFGAGFSSMQRLCQLPFNEIKLDAEFVRNLDKEPRCQAMIGSILALGDTLDMTVVIEGIENFVQLEQLLALGCSYGQGFWLGKPMAGDTLISWLQDRQPAVPYSSQS